MAEKTCKPVIFLAFANDRDDTVGYLRNLPVEARQIREPLQRARRDGLCELVELANATADDIFRVFQDAEYRDRIAVFHYGGHANGYQLLLESADGKSAAADAGGLAAFLGQQRGLDLVFLNGCSTRQQVKGLLDANVSAVIATSRAIDDQVATEFARQFYQGLAGGANIQTAYHEAESAIRTTKGGDTRGLYFGDAQSDEGTAMIREERSPWELVIRDGADVVANWSLPEAAGDPLFGLPPLPDQDLPASPFRHLSWFDREHADLFFGRGHQIRELYELVRSSDTAPIVLLYGQSGVGKSSMLAAGLIPRLEHDCEVRYLRRDREMGLVETLRTTFVELGGTKSTTETIHFSEDWTEVEKRLGKPLVVILDQVEEVFTLPNDEFPQEIDDFVNHLAKTFGNRQRRPQGRLILGFRKEWLAELEERLLKGKISRAKVFLDRLGRRGVIEAVMGPTRSQRLTDQYGLTVEEGLAEVIADDLLEDSGSAIAPTLQILLTKMWQEATSADDNHPHFDKQTYQRLKREGVLLRDFFAQQIDRFRDRFPEAMESGLLLDVLAMHTTSLGTADQRTVEQLQQSYAHLDQALPALLQQCQDLHLLTVATTSGQAEDSTTRLVHDTLAPLVREEFDESDKPGQRARRILNNRSLEWENDRVGAPLDTVDLLLVEQGVAGTRALTLAEQRLLAASRLERDKRRRWQRALAIFGSIAMLIIVCLAVIAGIARNRALRSEQSARASLKVAQTAVDEMLAKVAGESLKDVPQLEQMRTTLLAKATELFSQLAKQDAATDELRREQAQAHFSLGKIHHVMDERAKAKQEYQLAIDQFTALIAGSSDPSPYRLDLMKAFNQFGWMQSTSLTPADAIEAQTLYDNALEQFALLDAEAKTQIEFQTQKALALINRGLLETGPASRQDFTAAIDLLSPYRTDDVSSATVKQGLLTLAYAHNNRARIADDSPQAPANSLQDFQTALVIAKQLRAAYPDDRDLKLEYAKWSNNVASQHFPNELSQAGASNKEAVELFEELARSAPNVRNELAWSYISQAAIQHARAEIATAVATLDKARTIFTELKAADPTNSDYQSGLDYITSLEQSWKPAATPQE